MIIFAFHSGFVTVMVIQVYYHYLCATMINYKIRIAAE